MSYFLAVVLALLLFGITRKYFFKTWSIDADRSAYERYCARQNKFRPMEKKLTFEEYCGKSKKSDSARKADYEERCDWLNKSNVIDFDELRINVTDCDSMVSFCRRNSLDYMIIFPGSSLWEEKCEDHAKTLVVFDNAGKMIKYNYHLDGSLIEKCECGIVQLANTAYASHREQFLREQQMMDALQMQALEDAVREPAVEQVTEVIIDMKPVPEEILEFPASIEETLKEVKESFMRDQSQVNETREFLLSPADSDSSLKPPLPPSSFLGFMNEIGC